jgi:hypothetical protein
MQKDIITDQEAIKKALCYPKNIPDSFLVKELTPIGYATFKGDKLPSGWSINDQFDIGTKYPVYNREGYFVIGKDAVGKKIVPMAWSKIKFY